MNHFCRVELDLETRPSDDKLDSISAWVEAAKTRPEYKAFVAKFGDELMNDPDIYYTLEFGYDYATVIFKACDD